MSLLPNFSCPLCAQNLIKKEKSLVCDNNHTFDYAKEGYVNLLPVQQKKSLQPGDDKTMVMARREFLELGHYQFLRNALVAEITAHINEHALASAELIDLGCGEGYYTAALKEALPNCNHYGFDISKPAIKYASKRNKSIHFAVATNAHIPLSESSVDVIMNVFAPLIGQECQRILKKSGVIYSVSPAAQHLIEIKNEIYQNAELHEQASAPDGFELSSSQVLTSKVKIGTENALKNLLTMTPFGWKTSEQSLQALIDQLPLTVTLDFAINTFKLKSH